MRKYVVARQKFRRKWIKVFGIKIPIAGEAEVVEKAWALGGYSSLEEAKDAAEKDYGFGLFFSENEGMFITPMVWVNTPNGKEAISYGIVAFDV